MLLPGPFELSHHLLERVGSDDIRAFRLNKIPIVLYKFQDKNFFF
jgi:hypothetical protein